MSLKSLDFKLLGIDFTWFHIPIDFQELSQNRLGKHKPKLHLEKAK